MKLILKLVILVQILSISIPTLMENHMIISMSYGFNLQGFLEDTVEAFKKNTNEKIKPIESSSDGDRKISHRIDQVDKRLIIETQRELDRLHYMYVKPDGIMGPRTKAAIEHFQTYNNLPVTGTPHPELLRTLQATESHLFAGPGVRSAVANTQTEHINRKAGKLNAWPPSDPTRESRQAGNTDTWSAETPKSQRYQENRSDVLSAEDSRTDRGIILLNRNLSKDQMRFLFCLALKKYPAEKNNQKFMKTLMSIEPDEIRTRYFGRHDWKGNNVFEKEEYFSAYLRERVEVYLENLPELPISYTNITKVAVRDYEKRKGGFSIDSPRFGPELERGGIAVSPLVDWDIPELIPADRSQAKGLLKKLEATGKMPVGVPLRWNNIYYAITVQIQDILPPSDKPGRREFLLRVEPKNMSLYVDSELTQLLHSFPIRQGMEGRMQSAQKRTDFSQLLTPPDGCAPISLPFVGGYPVFGEYLSKEHYKAHTKSRQQRAFLQKEDATKFNYRIDLGKYIDLLAIADSPDTLKIQDIERVARELAGRRSTQSPVVRKASLSLYVRAKFLTEDARNSFIQYFPERYSRVGFAGRTDFEKQDSILQLHRSLPVEALSSWGQSLPRRILYVTEAHLEYDHERGGFNLGGFHEDNGLCLKANCFINSGQNVNLLKSSTAYFPVPVFFPTSETEAERLASRLANPSSHRLRGIYVAWTIDLLQQEVGKEVAIQPVAADLYFDKKLTEKLYTFNLDLGLDKQQSHEIAMPAGRQPSAFSRLTSPPSGIKAIQLHQIGGVPTYLPLDRDRVSGNKAYIWKRTVPPSFREYIALAILASNPASFSFDYNKKDAVPRFWTNFLNDEERKLFIAPVRRADGKIIYDEYTGQMKFDKQWQGMTPFEHIDSAKRFYDQYNTTLKEWAKEVFTGPAELRLIQPVRIYSYNFERQEFPLEMNGSPVYDLFHSKHWNNQYSWSFNHEMEKFWPVPPQQASVANRKLVDRAKFLHKQRSGGGSRFALPNYFTAYRALTVRLHPGQKSANSGYIEVTADSLYLDSQLSEKLGDFTVKNKQPVMLGGSQGGAMGVRKQPLRLHAETVRLLELQKKGLPTDSGAWDELMKSRRLFERLHTDQCAELFFKPDFPIINDRYRVPAKVRQQFQQWMRLRVENLEPFPTLELHRKGPKRNQVHSQTTLYALFDYPKAKKLKNPAQTRIRLEKLDSAKYPELTVGAGYVTLSVSPDMLQNVKPGDTSNMVTSLKYMKVDGDHVVLQPLSTRLTYQDEVLAEQQFSEQQISQWQHDKEERKHYLLRKNREKGNLSYRETKELEVYLNKEELGKLKEESIKAGLKRQSQAASRIVDKSVRKKTPRRSVSLAAQSISRSSACRAFRNSKYNSGGVLNQTAPDITKTCYFFWSEADSDKLYQNHLLDWGNRGRPKDSNAWFVVKAEVSVRDCTNLKDDVYIIAQDYKNCQEQYCFEHDSEIIYRPEEAEALFTNPPDRM